MKTFLIVSALTCITLVGYAIVRSKRGKKDKEWEPSNNKEDQTDNIFFT